MYQSLSVRSLQLVVVFGMLWVLTLAAHAQTAPTSPTTPTSTTTPTTLTPVVTCPQLTESLSMGQSDKRGNGQIVGLQQYLAKREQVPESEMVTGYFGKRTRELVMKFQENHGLPQVGIVGPQTRAALAKECAEFAKNPNVAFTDWWRASRATSSVTTTHEDRATTSRKSTNRYTRTAIGSIVSGVAVNPVPNPKPACLMEGTLGWGSDRRVHTLTWQTERAASATLTRALTNGRVAPVTINVATSGTLVASSTIFESGKVARASYTLTATNSSGSVTCTVWVTRTGVMNSAQASPANMTTAVSANYGTSAEGSQSGATAGAGAGAAAEVGSNKGSDMSGDKGSETEGEAESESESETESESSGEK